MARKTVRHGLLRRIRRVLFHNFWLKLLALALAVAIYFMLKSGSRESGAAPFEKGIQIDAERQA